ncbi:MAG TPA: AAA family ATPase [Bacillota bacterium]|nr:AAA family ATPase [Bacillota bacterium]
MINTEKLRQVLALYKKDHAWYFAKEKYKWETVKHFHVHWNINAPVFSDMFAKATELTGNLLASRYYFPRKMILRFCDADEETVRGMFLDLYDESRDLTLRVEKFIAEADTLKEKYTAGKWDQHYQNINSISTYLWLRYPDKYYIFNHNVLADVAKCLENPLPLKRSAGTANLLSGFELYDEIRREVAKDNELVELLQVSLDENCHPDESLRTLTMDIGYYISTVYLKNAKNQSKWFPSDYEPNISVETWVELLQNDEVFTESSLEIMKRMKDIGGEATCKQLSEKYGETPNFYNAGSSSLARRVAKFTNCPVPTKNTENSKWWPILYVGRYSDDKTKGVYIWKLRNELSEALDRVDLSRIKLYATSSENRTTINYWRLNANPKVWSFSDLSTGSIQYFTFYNERGNRRRVFQNFVDAKPGDLVVGYEANPTKKIVALGTIAENDGERLGFEKTEALLNPISYSDLKGFEELKDMEFFANPNGTLFKLTKAEYEFILDLIREENPEKTEQATSYTEENFLNEVYMSREDLETLLSLLRNKKNLILEGPPGVGKTFAAKRLAYAYMKQEKDENIELVQFHQNYSYEDFVMGYKPKEDGFELEYGIFYRFCQKASNKPDEPFFFIIDEINRGNLSKIFGELLMLIERDYRGMKVTLAYDKRAFFVPENVHIIGMMNTADRSLALIDYALRRRFCFFKMEPGFDSEGFKAYQKTLNNETFDALIEKVKELNRAIAADRSLGRHFCIGHSYFCERTPHDCTGDWMKEVVEHEIIPLIQEYWFDDEDKHTRWANTLRGVFSEG